MVLKGKSPEAFGPPNVETFQFFLRAVELLAYLTTLALPAA